MPSLEIGGRLAGRFKRGVRSGARRLQTRMRALLHAEFGPDDLVSCLRSIGVVEGTTLMVHSSYDAFHQFTGKPSDAVQALATAVGAHGTLMMPTLPFTGTAIAFVESARVVDLGRLPSRTGLLTELFRRTAKVARSHHPTHPVAILGPNAPASAAAHSLAGTPCGRFSPFAELLERRGRIALAGVDIESLTYYHFIEEMIEPALPRSPFTARVFEIETRRPDGTMFVARTRLFDPEVSRRRRISHMLPELRRRGGWQEARIGGMTVAAIDPEIALTAARDLADRGIYCYA